MKFSLILATINRTEEVIRFFKSLEQQTYKQFEVIVVDQNSDGRISKILANYSESFSFVHLQSIPGLSRARNVGLKYISGDIIAFPDDDCWYPEDLLEKVVNFHTINSELDGVTGYSVDEQGKPSSTNRWNYNSGIITRKNVWQKAISFSIFLRKSVIEKTGKFDESLGVGAGTPWGSGEETDYMLRIIKNGLKVYYNPSLFVYHLDSIKVFDDKAVSRGYSYSSGHGRVLRKHNYSVLVILYELIRSLGGLALSFIQIKPKKAKFYWANFRGKLRGYLSNI